MNLEETIAWHMQHHPFLNVEDAVKLVFQSMFGCGHLLDNAQTVESRIISEAESVQSYATTDLIEPCGDYTRISLAHWKTLSLPYHWLAKMMLLTAQYSKPCSTEEYLNALLSLENISIKSAKGEALTAKSMHDYASSLILNHSLPSHSVEYRASEHPHYRIVSTATASLIPILKRINRLPATVPILIAIDGCCGSGKTTMAAMLSSILDAQVIHMDDFFTPHRQKTPERLSQPGGNADLERFYREVIDPLTATGTCTYRPYLCHADAYGDAITVTNSRITIVQGSYCLHPQLGQPYALRIFLRISKEKQAERIIKRNGAEMYKMFRDRWIPMQEHYFSSYSLPDSDCITFIDDICLEE